MTDNDRDGKSSLKNVVVEDCGEDNVHIENADVDIDGLQSRRAGRRGLHISKKPKSDKDDANNHWYKKPIGILGLTVAGGLLLAAAKFAFEQFFSP